MGVDSERKLWVWAPLGGSEPPLRGKLVAGQEEEEEEEDRQVVGRPAHFQARTPPNHQIQDQT